MHATLRAIWQYTLATSIPLLIIIAWLIHEPNNEYQEPENEAFANSTRNDAFLFFKKLLDQKISYKSPRVFENTLWELQPSAHVDQKISFCIVIPSIYRKQGYLLRTVRSLLENATKEEWNELVKDVIIYNADVNLQRNIHARFLSLLFTVVNKPYDDQVAQWVAHKLIYLKANYDYRALLDVCKVSGAKYTVTIEDDAIAHKGYLTAMRKAIEQVHEKYEYNDNAWAWLKLYFVHKYDGWEIASHFWLLVIMSLVVSLPVCMFVFWQWHGAFLTRMNFVMYMAYCTVAVFIALYMIGNQSFNKFRSHVIPFKHSGSTVAQIYPSVHLNILSEFFKVVQQLIVTC